MITEIGDLVRIPSVCGTDAENDAQSEMARRFVECGLEVDHWPLDLDALAGQPDFPGMEVDRDEAWGLVGRLAGAGDGPTLMLNGHVDVVPIGDPEAWAFDPFSGHVRDGRLFGRGA